MVQVTAFFCGILTLIYFFLSIYVVGKRGHLKVAIGDGNDANLGRRIRAHANFAEYVPLVLLLMLINELNGMRSLFLFILGTVFLFGRLSHAYSLIHAEQANPGRFSLRKAG